MRTTPAVHLTGDLACPAVSDMDETLLAVWRWMRAEGAVDPKDVNAIAGGGRGAGVKAVRRLATLGLAQPAVPARAPIWWEPLPVAPEGWTDPGLQKGDRFESSRDSSGQGWIEIASTRVDEDGLVIVSRTDAADVRVRIALPAHVITDERHYWPMREAALGEVTEYSRRFACPVHGECTEAMVRTDKCCAVCGTGLIRQ